MKVKELEKGMLLTPAGDNEWFALYGDHEKYLHVRIKPGLAKKPMLPPYAFPNFHIRKSRTAIYLGTKKDLKINQVWCNQFVFFDGEILGVEPSAWKRIRSVI